MTEYKTLYHVVPPESFEAEDRVFLKGKKYPVYDRNGRSWLCAENGDFNFTHELMEEAIVKWQLEVVDDNRDNPVKELIEKIKSLGWSVEEEGDDYRVGKYSPAGQDFSIVIEGESPEDLVDSIKRAYDDFDVSNETYLWLDESGHGANGAPHEMKDVLEDMETCKEMIADLHHELSQWEEGL